MKVTEASAPTVELPEVTECDYYKFLIKGYDWDDDIAIAVMMAESMCNANAVNDNPNTGDYSVGLFQINLIGNLAKDRPSEAKLKDARFNVEYAYKMYQSSGWKPWSAFKNGSYKKYL